MCSHTGIASVYVIARQISVKAISFPSKLQNTRNYCIKQEKKTMKIALQQGWVEIKSYFPVIKNFIQNL